MTSDTLSIVVDVNKVSDTTNQDDNIYERIKKAAQDGDIERLYKLVAEDPYILKHFEIRFCWDGLREQTGRSSCSSIITVVLELSVITLVMKLLRGSVKAKAKNWMEDSMCVGLPMWKVLYGSIAALGTANFAMLTITFPTSHTEHRPGEVILKVFLFTYPAITAIIVFAPFAVFFLNKWRRRRVDFPASAI
ncbi:hypothetical protein HID58_042110 [Brassica napus]|uniref:Uncharacterized protein n=1 Tax=Brassica napus TaxID=3708 RepID=A0ABQ8BCS4_BRANA|nr:hypothetical protein HID58_042110 [Brassica napus]